MNMQLLSFLPSSKEPGRFFMSIISTLKYTAPFLERELHELKKMGLVENRDFGMTWGRTPSGDEVVRHHT